MLPINLTYQDIIKQVKNDFDRELMRMWLVLN